MEAVMGVMSRAAEIPRLRALIKRHNNPGYKTCRSCSGAGCEACCQTGYAELSETAVENLIAERLAATADQPEPIHNLTSTLSPTPAPEPAGQLTFGW
jgi:hypothetical protein